MSHGQRRGSLKRPKKKAGRRSRRSRDHWTRVKPTEDRPGRSRDRASAVEDPKPEPRRLSDSLALRISTVADSLKIGSAIAAYGITSFLGLYGHCPLPERRPAIRPASLAERYVDETLEGGRATMEPFRTPIEASQTMAGETSTAPRAYRIIQSVFWLKETTPPRYETIQVYSLDERH
jgi:hypothetical protein